ncbi:hypothetical protein ABW19_dt0205661 [Dactylella cylindrospora]|nr:hypothetical protein ABW19_dt0205661 [Dactylella cylindrospora]
MAETATTHLGRKMLAERRRHQLLANGTRGFTAMDSAEMDVDIDALVKGAGHPSPTETDWWWKKTFFASMPQKSGRNLVHIKTVNTVVTMDGWNDLLEHIERYPLATEPQIRTARQNRILPVTGPRHTASFAITMTELLMLSTRLPQLRRSGFTWRPTWPSLGLGRSIENAPDLTSDHRAKFKFAPRGTPSELLLSLDSQVLTKRPLLYVKHVALDIAWDPASGCVVDITTSDVGDHISLFPLLYKREFQPIDLVVRLFDQEVDRWTAFVKAYGLHIKALRTYLYDNRVQKATINTILSSLKLVDNLLLIAANNAETIEQFLSPDVFTQKSHIPQFWLWRHPSNTPSDSESEDSPLDNSGEGSSGNAALGGRGSGDKEQILLERACPTQYAELRRDKEYFLQVQDTLKGWEVDLRGQMQLIFNLISIDEAYRSREQNTSLKRLSWITFIFLPMLFMSSLFGMNIDLLANDPAWWWYIVWTVPALCLILGVTVGSSLQIRSANSTEPSGGQARRQ